MKIHNYYSLQPFIFYEIAHKLLVQSTYYILLNFVKHVCQIFWQQKISFVPNFRAFLERAKNNVNKQWIISAVNSLFFFY